MSCWLQNQWRFLENNLFKKVTFAESSVVRMSCLSFMISARVSGQINLSKMPEGRRDFHGRPKRRRVMARNVADALNGLRRDDKTENEDEEVWLFKQRDSVPKRISTTSPPARRTSLVCRRNILQPLQAAAIVNQYLQGEKITAALPSKSIKRDLAKTFQSSLQDKQYYLLPEQINDVNAKTRREPSFLGRPEKCRPTSGLGRGPGTRSSADGLAASTAAENQTEISLCEKVQRRRLQLWFATWGILMFRINLGLSMLEPSIKAEFKAWNLNMVVPWYSVTDVGGSCKVGRRTKHVCVSCWLLIFCTF